MKLSDAIRKGAQERPFGATGLFGDDIHDNIGMVSCALGAAYEATFGPPDFETWGEAAEAEAYDRLDAIYPMLRATAECPVGGNPCCAKEQLSDVIWHLNDHHNWTREQVADWVDTLGPQS